MTRSGLRLSSAEFVERVRAASPSTEDDVPVTRDGRRLASKDAVLAFLAEVESDRAAGRHVEFDDDLSRRHSTSIESSPVSPSMTSTSSSLEALPRSPTGLAGRRLISTASHAVAAKTWIASLLYFGS